MRSLMKKDESLMRKEGNSVVFGPVPSRRLGRSLGIDVVPFKTCTYDCIYCQLGKTTNLTTERAEFVTVGQVIDELREHLSRIPRPDYITISGSGEPTLYTKLAELVDEIKKVTDIPLALLTNGSLFWRKEVREACCPADLVVPSLDAGDESTFRHVNRPHSEISFIRMTEGLKEFRKEFPGDIWLEVFLLGGVTGIVSEVLKIKKYIDEILPDRVQVNTIHRPPAEDFVNPLQAERMGYLSRMLGDKAEVIADYQISGEKGQFGIRREDIISLLKRRPCSVHDISEGLGMHLNEVIEYVDGLQTEGIVKLTSRNGALYYSLTN